jgi:hypothetical protein
MSLVGNLVKRTKQQFSEYEELLADKEKVLSFNKVTGYSVNFPIYRTCKPTTVCSKTCYYAKAGSSWPAALKKQLRLYNSVVADPAGLAVRLSKEIDARRKKLSFIRWNGGGDLFEESVVMLNHFADLKPELPIWLVTRIPKLAAKVVNRPNLFIHFSLDAASFKRREEFEKIDKLSDNYFYSYQCDKDENPGSEKLLNTSVVFFDRYLPKGDFSHIEEEIVCPLNTRKDITNTCEECRRCFDASATKHRMEIKARR